MGKKKLDKKKGVHMMMMYRDHQDPNYEDPTVNDRIFVPVDGKPRKRVDKKAEEEKEEILKAFDAKDLGQFEAKPEENDDDYPSAEMIKKVVREAKGKKKVRFAGDDSSDSMEDDSIEEEDKLDGEDGRFDDPTEELESLNKLKVASGVKTVRYDEFGISLSDDVQKFISKGEMAPGAVFFPAPVSKNQGPQKNYFRDYEKQPEKMTAEEKAVFDCLQDEEGEYEELDDDFLFLANEGNVALVEDEDKGKEKEDAKKEDKSDDEELEDDEEIFVEKKITKYAEKLDAKDPQFNEYFNQVMHEYEEEDIGEGEEDESTENIDLIDKDALDSILDEFLETEKNRKPVKEAIEKIQGIRRSENIAEVKAMDDTTKEDIKKKIIELDNEEEVEEEETQSSDEEAAQEKQWDAETILTTYTNTENHPKVIKEEDPTKRKRNRKPKSNKKDEKEEVSEEQPQDDTVEVEVEESSEKKVESKEDKKARKKQVKEERREKRAQKKQLKEVFKNEHGKISKIQTGNSGDVKPGVSIRRIYCNT